MREKHQSVASCMRSNHGSNPQPFGIWDDAPTNWATWPGQLTKHFMEQLWPRHKAVSLEGLGWGMGEQDSGDVNAYRTYPVRYYKKFNLKDINYHVWYRVDCALKLSSIFWGCQTLVHTHPGLSPADAGERALPATAPLGLPASLPASSITPASSTCAQKEPEMRRPWESANLYTMPETPCENSHGSSANAYWKVFISYLFPHMSIIETGSYHSTRTFTFKTIFFSSYQETDEERVRWYFKPKDTSRGGTWRQRTVS